MKFVLLLFFVSFFLSLKAKGNKDTIVYRYLLIQKKSNLHKAIIIVEGREITVTDSSGRKARGKVYIINDSMFQLHNIWKDKPDTFNINAVNRIFKTTVAGVLFSTYYFIGGLILTSAGISIYPFDDNRLAFLVLTTTGMEISLIGYGIYSTMIHKKKHKNFKIYQARGYKLRHKHLKYLNF